MGNLTERQLEFVTFIHQRHALTGELLTEQKAKDEFDIPFKFFRECMANEDVKEALSERGIELKAFHTDPSSWRSQALTPLQLLTANKMLDLADTKSDKRKLQELGVSTTQYQSWLRDPVFSDYIRSRAELLLGDSQHKAHLALLDKVEQGDVRAIAYYNELTNRFTPNANKGQSDNAVVNLQQIIVRIVEIITDEVDDPETVLRIGDKLQTLMSGHMLAQSAVPESDVTMPEVKQARTYTPKLKELLESGEGINL